MVNRICPHCTEILRERPLAGLCRSCYWAEYNWKRRFDGNREQVIQRDDGRCRGCGAEGDLIVHHRRPGFHYAETLVTLCRPCHAQVHGLSAVRHYMGEFLYRLWIEQHPGHWKQLQFPL